MEHLKMEFYREIYPLKEKSVVVEVSDFNMILYREVDGQKMGVSKEWLDAQGLSIEDGLDKALDNTKQEFTYGTLPSMTEKFLGVAIEKEIESILELKTNHSMEDIVVPNFLYMITNKEMNHGSYVIFQPENMKKLCSEIGTEDLILMPMSIHEVIAIRKQDVEKYDFHPEVYTKDIFSKLPLRDKLSNQPIRYNSKTEKFSPLHSQERKLENKKIR